MGNRTTPFSKLLLMLVLSVLLALVSGLGVFDSVQDIGVELNLSLSRPFSGLISKLDSGWHLVTNLQQIQVENLQLKEELAKTHQQVDALRDLQSQNQFLSTQINLQLPRPNDAVLAAVVRYEYSPTPGYIYARIGLQTQIEQGDLVLRYNYIVGEVVKVFGEYAKIRLISATDSVIPVRVGPKQVVGELAGRAGLNFTVNKVDQNAEINVGDEILILDQAGQDLRGYLFGTVAKITGLESESTKTLEVNSPIDLNHLDYVIIVPNHV